MTTEIETTRSSRRGLLAAGLGAAAAAVVASVARFAPAAAQDASPSPGASFEIQDIAEVGVDNISDAPTTFTTDTSDALKGVSNEARGVSGKSITGQGVHGQSDQVAGVAGLSDSGSGVHGRSTSASGVMGQSETGAGVEGSGAIGVKASGQVGVEASSSDGFALQTTSGRVRFEGISGVAVIEAGDTQTVIRPPISVNANTIVLLTGQADNGGRSLWFSRNQDANELFIRMSSPRNNPTRIAYLILEHA